MRIILAGMVALLVFLTTLVGAKPIEGDVSNGARVSVISEEGLGVVQPANSAAHPNFVISPVKKMLGITLSIFFIVVVVYFVVREHLTLDYALPWILAGTAMGLLAAFFDQIIIPISKIFDINIPILLLLLIGIIFLFFLNFYANMRLSIQERRIKNLIQDFGIAKLELRQHVNRNKSHDDDSSPSS